jgi:hypothetical protein
MNIEVYQCPEGHKRAGKFTLRIDGEESLYYSPTKEGVEKRAAWIMNGLPKGTVTLRAVPAGVKPMLTESEGKPEPINPFALPTAEERAAAFMSRGKLAKT